MADFSTKGSTKSKGIYTLISNNLNTVLLTLNIFALGVIIYLFFYPPFINAKSENSQVFDDVSKIIQINEEETPIIAQIDNVEDIRSINSVMAEVYEKARDGDYFLAFSDRIIIYRKQDKAIIYNGPSPSQIVEARRAQLISNIKNAAQANGVEISFDETPQLVAVIEPESIKGLDSEFYKDIQQNDVIAVFQKSEKIVVYRATDGSIINSAEYKSIISKE